MICEVCGWWDRLCHCKELELFNTSKDKLWEFNEQWLDKNVEIRTKRQWKRFMKEHGLNDDVKQSRRTPHDYIKQRDNKEQHRKELANCMYEILREKNRIRLG